MSSDNLRHCILQAAKQSIERVRRDIRLIDSCSPSDPKTAKKLLRPCLKLVEALLETQASVEGLAQKLALIERARLSPESAKHE